MGKTLESEWGLALHLESKKGQETRRYLLDFGFMPTTYQNNRSVLNIDVAQIDALIVSHGHYDHIAGEGQRERPAATPGADGRRVWPNGVQHAASRQRRSELIEKEAAQNDVKLRVRRYVR